ncbi:unnamed protein product [Dicrocoelium dendriticum]|nr:unnamed protein product [Dicrocoelium dendriticum]
METKTSVSRVLHSAPKYSKQQAAILIQSIWRGFRVRSKLRKVNNAIILLQRAYRERRTRKLHVERNTLVEAEFQHSIRLTRHRRWREKLEAEMSLLSSLPPTLVERADHQRRNEAACKIQAFFRGYLVRVRLSEQREKARRDKAAKVLQRYVRQYLSSKEYSEFERLRVPQAIEDGIADKGSTLSLDEVRKDETNRANLARMKVDAELLLSEPGEVDMTLEAKTSESRAKRFTAPMASRTNTTLARAVDRHRSGPSGKPALDAFVCRAQPLAALAKQEHRARMLSLSKPWWKLTAHKLQEDKLKWFQATEQRQNGMAGDQEEASTTWRRWLPDHTLSKCDDEYLMMEECSEPIYGFMGALTRVT